MDRQGFAHEVATTARCLGKNINWCLQAQGHIAESTSRTAPSLLMFLCRRQSTQGGLWGCPSSRSNGACPERRIPCIATSNSNYDLQRRTTRWSAISPQRYGIRYGRAIHVGGDDERLAAPDSHQRPVQSFGGRMVNAATTPRWPSLRLHRATSAGRVINMTSGAVGAFGLAGHE